MAGHDQTLKMDSESAEHQGRMAQEGDIVDTGKVQRDHGAGNNNYTLEGDVDTHHESNQTQNAAQTCKNANGVRCDTVHSESSRELRYADLLEEGQRDALAHACSAQGWSVRATPRRVYDCVNFFQEDKMLLLRMHELVRWCVYVCDCAIDSTSSDLFESESVHNISPLFSG
jgi:hypothetical protein